MKPPRTRVKPAHVPTPDAPGMAVRTVEPRTPAPSGEPWWGGALAAETHLADRWKPVAPASCRLANKMAVCEATAVDLYV